MLFLRWVLGIGCGLALAFFALAMIVGGGIRSAYQSGAGVEDLLRDVAMYATPLLLAAMLGSVFVPHSRMYMNVVAVGAGLALAGCATILPSHPGEGMLYIGFFALWFVYFFLSRP